MVNWGREGSSYSTDAHMDANTIKVELHTQLCTYASVDDWEPDDFGLNDTTPVDYTFTIVNTDATEILMGVPVTDQAPAVIVVQMTQTEMLIDTVMVIQDDIS